MGRRHLPMLISGLLLQVPSAETFAGVAVAIIILIILASSIKVVREYERDVLGQVEFDELLTKREELNKRLQAILDEVTEPWGVKVSAVSIKDVAIAVEMQRAIAKQAEAEREKRSRIIMAEGELIASEKMSQAAIFYSKHMAAMRLRELQTWAEIAREKNMIVVTGGDSQNLGPILGIVKEKLQHSQADTSSSNTEESSSA